MWKVPEQTPKGLCLTTSSPLNFTPPDKSEALTNHPAKGAVVRRWAESKEGG